MHACRHITHTVVLSVLLNHTIRAIAHTYAKYLKPCNPKGDMFEKPGCILQVRTHHKKESIYLSFLQYVFDLKSPLLF